ncbi:hypothetical protein KKA66_00790 [Patescibacteria group bacterium]|nr:hypothetical protein [Patescibacteria group bacterium]
MINPESTINKNAEHRIKKAEKKNELSLSYRKGELHSHTGYHLSDVKSPEDTDEHKNKFVKAENVTKDDYTEVIKDRGHRFWRCMKIAEKYFNELFNELGIKKENIINTFSVEELEKFIKK